MLTGLVMEALCTAFVLQTAYALQRAYALQTAYAPWTTSAIGQCGAIEEAERCHRGRCIAVYKTGRRYRAALLS